MKKILMATAAAVMIMAAAPHGMAAETKSDKARLIVLTDIEADADDSESLVRLLLYSSEIDIEAIIATTSVHQKTMVAPDTIRRTIDAYGKVQPNLLKHEAGFPDAKSLLARVSEGLAVYGMAGVGDGKDSPGSRRIVQILDEADDRPVWVAVWGGPNTLAQALYTIRKSRSPAEAARLVAKLRVYTISDQDDSGAWMRKTFPELYYVVSPGGYGAGTWTGIMHAEPGLDNSEISTAWLSDNIQQGHGPLGLMYPDVAYGMEGDTPSFLWLIPNGLNAPDHPDWGGWGGRYKLYIPQMTDMDPTGFTGGVPIETETRPIWTNAIDTYTPYVAADHGRAVAPAAVSSTGYRTTLWRWRKDFQNDFAARMDWTIKPYGDANHPPIVRLGHADHFTVKSGETFWLSAAGSSDPDGDSLSYLWFNYVEAGSLAKPVAPNWAENLYRLPVTAPTVSRPETAHFILKVTDKGSPPLTRYARVIVTIVP